MIEGFVNVAYQAVVPLTLQGPAGQTYQAEAAVDTGFNSFLTLPPRLIEELHLPRRASSEAVLADGSEVRFQRYEVTVIWDGRARNVYAYAADTMPLIGMHLLSGYNLHVEVHGGGRVLIAPAS